MTPKFPLGQTVMTRALHDWVSEDAAVRHPLVMACLQKHASGDWGGLPPHERQANDDALKYGNRLLSSYTVLGVRVWISTEADRSSTTLLFPDDY